MSPTPPLPEAVTSVSLADLRLELDDFFSEVSSTPGADRDVALADLADSIIESRGLDEETRLDLLAEVSIAFASLAPLRALLVARSDFYGPNELRLWQSFSRVLDAHPSLVDEALGSVAFHVFRFAVEERSGDAEESQTREARIAWQMLSGPGASLGRIHSMLLSSLHLPVPRAWKPALVRRLAARTDLQRTLVEAIGETTRRSGGAAGEQVRRRAEDLRGMVIALPCDLA